MYATVTRVVYKCQNTYKSNKGNNMTTQYNKMCIL